MRRFHNTVRQNALNASSLIPRPESAPPTSFSPSSPTYYQQQQPISAPVFSSSSSSTSQPRSPSPSIVRIGPLFVNDTVNTSSPTLLTKRSYSDSDESTSPAEEVQQTTPSSCSVGDMLTEMDINSTDPPAQHSKRARSQADYEVAFPIEQATVIARSTQQTDALSTLISLAMEVADSRTRVERDTKRFESISRLPFHTISTSNIGRPGIAARHLVSTDYMHPKANTRFLGLTRLKEWMCTSVQLPLNAAGSDQIGLFLQISPPCKIGVFRSDVGSGVCQYIIEVCKELLINLFIVRPDCISSPQRLCELFEEAHLVQPSIVLFDRCGGWFGPGRYEQCAAPYFYALRSSSEAQNANETAAQKLTTAIQCTSPIYYKDNVWTIVSLTSNEDVDPHLLDVCNHRVNIIEKLGREEMRAFMTLYIRQLLQRSGSDTDAKMVTALDVIPLKPGEERPPKSAEALLEERVTSWMDVFKVKDTHTYNPPGLVTLIVSRCLEAKMLRFSHQYAQRNEVAVSVELHLQSCIPTELDLRQQLSYYVAGSKETVRQFAAYHQNQQGDFTRNVLNKKH